MKKNIFELLRNEIINGNEDISVKRELLNNLEKLQNKKINLMITGATGSGKSSTINALFDMEVAKVGTSANPETMGIERYELDNLVIWDTPGLGDGKEADNRHSKNIVKKLYEKDENGNLLIDLVLVVIDGSTRDLGTAYQLINEVIIPNLGENKHRILVAINQSDMAMKGRYWNYEENKPEPKLVEFLEEKVISIKRRIKESTGIDVNPIYYSAGEKEEGKAQAKPYNLSKLLYYILEHTPKEKRIIYAQNINQEPEMWKRNDELQDYGKNIMKGFVESIATIGMGITKGVAIGGTIGSLFGGAGKVIGSVVGGIIGGIGGVVKSFFGGIFG